MQSSTLLLVVAAFAAVVYSAPAGNGNTIVDIAASTPDLSTLVTAVKAGGLVGVLSGPGPFTVFAPTNEAFAALPAGLLNFLLQPQNKAKLDAVLEYHVLAGAVYSRSLRDHQSATTLEGSNITVFITGPNVFINTAQVLTADVTASNGVVHIINKVLIPPTLNEVAGQFASTAGNIIDIAVNTPDLSTLVTAVKAAGLVDTLSGPGPFTVFAPTNEAFAALPPGVLSDLLLPQNKQKLIDVLTYHVVAGNIQAASLKNQEKIKTVEGANITVFIEFDGVYVDHAKIVESDVEASNGVVHVINQVILPPHFS